MSDEIEEVDSIAQATSEPQAIVEETSEPQIQEAPKEDFYKVQYENLQKDYTVKSMKLAELEKIKDEPVQKEAWEEPNWQPKTWQEVFEAGKQATLREVSPLLSEVEQAKQQRDAQAQATTAAEAEMSAIKTKDASVNEDLVYKIANKYGSTLSAAYQFLKDTQELEKTVEQRVLKNLKIRGEDNVGVNNGTIETDDTPTYDEIHSHKSIFSAAKAALARTKGK